VPPTSSRRKGQEQQWRTAVAMPDLPQPQEPSRLHQRKTMIEILTGVAFGILLVAVLSFLFGFISAWVKDKQ
jgi:fatty acid desaturase